MTVYINNDQACYDRTVFLMALLAFQWIRLSPGMDFAIENTLQPATHDKNLAFGLSVEK